MTNCWPSALLSAVATARVRMSVLMPGGNGQITVTGRTGQGSAASAGVAAIMKAVAIQTAARSINFASHAQAGDCGAGAILPSAERARKARTAAAAVVRSGGFPPARAGAMILPSSRTGAKPGFGATKMHCYEEDRREEF